ncbi:MAG: cytochrome b N-terminal domain-containing protein [Anaplasmataceae bacterium]|nr:cytochrome b N-terminal domain-containing protein [Anaplasmataceae bacterium]
MSNDNKIIDQSKTGSVVDWIEYRLPVFSFIKHLCDYRTPINLSFMWNFGILAGIALVVQIVTGLFLAMHYTPHVAHAFDSVEHIMRDVQYGWLLRYTHAVGASFFFIVIFAHIARGLYYGSYKSPREIVWICGVILYVLMMATAFMGYVLPWGQMSFWGATVITNLFSAIPLIGDSIVSLLWGGFSVDNPTLNRFFVLHYLIPFIIAAFAVIHVIALHQFGSTNPTGVEVKNVKKETVPFHPYYTYKDLVYVVIFFLVLFMMIAFLPDYLGHPDNYIEANPMITPSHIVPEWYFLPFYAILRAIPDKLMGVLGMFGAIAVLFVVPWLDRHPTKSGKYRKYFKIAYWIFIFNFLCLMWLGGQEAAEPYLTLSRISLCIYFSYFLVALPLLSKYEPISPDIPESIESSLKSKG